MFEPVRPAIVVIVGGGDSDEADGIGAAGRAAWHGAGPPVQGVRVVWVSFGGDQDEARPAAICIGGPWRFIVVREVAKDGIEPEAEDEAFPWIIETAGERGPGCEPVFLLEGGGIGGKDNGASGFR